MNHTEKEPDVTDEFFPVTLVETVGEYNAETDTISVCVQSYRDPHVLFAVRLSEIPAEMREAAKGNGYKFWAKIEITNIPIEAGQEGDESLKLSDMEPMKQIPTPTQKSNDDVMPEEATDL